MTATVPDVDSLQALDWNHVPACLTPEHQNDPPAARWVLVGLLPCGHTLRWTLLCDPCSAKMHAHWRTCAEPPGWQCRECGALYDSPSTPADFLRIEPLL